MFQIGLVEGLMLEPSSTLQGWMRMLRGPSPLTPEEERRLVFGETDTT